MDETVVDETQPQTDDDMSRLIENEHNQEYGEDDSLTTSPNTGNTKKWLIIGVGVLVVGIAIWYFVINKGKTTTAPATNPATPSGRNRTYVYLIQEGATGSPPGPQTTAPPTNVGGQPPTTTPIVTPQPTTTTPTTTTPTVQITPAQQQLVNNTGAEQQKLQSMYNYVAQNDKARGVPIVFNSTPVTSTTYGGAYKQFLSQGYNPSHASTMAKIAVANPNYTQHTVATSQASYGQLYKQFLANGYTPSGASAMARNAVANPNAVYPS